MIEIIFVLYVTIAPPYHTVKAIEPFVTLEECEKGGMRLGEYIIHDLNTRFTFRKHYYTFECIEGIIT